MDWKRQFVQELLDVKEDPELDNAIKLLRSHDQNLENQGDLSFPSNPQVWRRILKSDLQADLSSKLEKISRIEKFKSTPNGHVSIWLNRVAFMTDFFKSFDLIDLFTKRPKLTVNIEYLDTNEKSPLTLIRCRQVLDFVKRLQSYEIVKQHMNDIEITSNDKTGSKSAVYIGPVMDKSTKKKSTLDFISQYLRFYKVLNEASKERLTDQSEAKRVLNVHAVTSAEMQLQLLANNVGQSAILDENASKTATFVLYNHARIVQLLNASPPIQDKDVIDFALLTEPEEWEIIYVYLSRYISILNEILATEKSIKINKLVQFLIGLSQAFSRYYNRVHVIKEHAPHLWPVQCSRLHLLKTVQRVLEHGLALMNIPCLGKM